jgi:hypothetical protein
MSPLKIKIPSKNLGKQRCAEGFISGVKVLSIRLLVYCYLFGNEYRRISRYMFYDQAKCDVLYQST